MHVAMDIFEMSCCSYISAGARHSGHSSCCRLWYTKYNDPALSGICVLTYYSFNTNSLIIIIHKPFTLSSFLAERDGMVPFLEHIFFTLSESRQKRI